MARSNLLLPLVVLAQKWDDVSGCQIVTPPGVRLGDGVRDDEVESGVAGGRGPHSCSSKVENVDSSMAIP